MLFNNNLHSVKLKINWALSTNKIVTIKIYNQRQEDQEPEVEDTEGREFLIGSNNF